jgi:predicted flap endonuclease-1-like 5' DNA nuclease
MSLLACCLWWFLLGLVLGWLLNWLLSKALRRDVPPTRTSLADPPTASTGAFTSTPAAIPASAAPTYADAPTKPPPSRLIDVGAARATGFNLKHADDLTIIEGIGPKIDELFRTHGVTGFAQLARVSHADMLTILENGGPHFKFANPSSWARQALLASENRWAELKILQEELIGGVDPADNH